MMSLLRRLFPPRPDPDAEKERIVQSFFDKAADLGVLERRTEMRIRKARADGARAVASKNPTRARLAAVTILRGQNKISQIQEQIWLLEESADAVETLGLQDGIKTTLDEANRMRGDTKVTARDTVKGLVDILRADGQRAPAMDEYITRILGSEPSSTEYDPESENPAVNDLIKEFEQEASSRSASRMDTPIPEDPSPTASAPDADAADILRQLEEARKGKP